MQKQSFRLLYIAHERKLGGASLSLLALIKEMKIKGHDITVIAPTSNCPIAKEIRKLNIPVIAIFMPWWQMPCYWNGLVKLCFRFFYFFEVFEVIYVLFCLKGKSIDIVHSNSSVIDFGAKIARYKGCKHIWHIREFGDADYDLEYIRGKKYTWNYINKHSNRIIFISQALKNYFWNYYDDKLSCLIYNGISQEYLINHVYNEKKDITFLVSGNLNKNKQQMLVLRAGKELLRRGISNFKIQMAGTSSSMSESQKYEVELRKYIDENLSNQVTILGHIAKMNEVRKCVDVEIIASTKEAFGRVTIEAMFAGLPVIVSDSGANVELVHDNEEGFWFRNEDYFDLADKMQYYIQNQLSIKIMGKRAFIYAKEKFTSENNAEKIEEIYCEVLR